MKTPRIFFVATAVAFLGIGSLAAADLDLPEATCRIKIGAQTIRFTPGELPQTKLIDGNHAKVGERRNSLMRVEWIIAPVEGIGDEYLFVVRRPNRKAQIHSAIFKGGYLQVAAEENLLIELEIED